MFFTFVALIHDYIFNHCKIAQLRWEKTPFGNDDNIFVSNFLRFLEKVGKGKSLISEEKTSTSFKIQGALNLNVII